jgi:hypothetical protein
VEAKEAAYGAGSLGEFSSALMAETVELGAASTPHLTSYYRSRGCGHQAASAAYAGLVEF